MYRKSWIAQRTIASSVAWRLIEVFDRRHQEHAYRENPDGSITVWFRMTVIS